MHKGNLRFLIQTSVIQKENGCIEWTRSKDGDGYGFIRFSGVLHRTHRIAYELFVGEIPAGMCVLHKCDNPPCINVDHLFLGTHADNNRDKFNKGRGVIPIKIWQPYCKRGHIRSPENLSRHFKCLICMRMPRKKAKIK